MRQLTSRELEMVSGGSGGTVAARSEWVNSSNGNGISFNFTISANGQYIATYSDSVSLPSQAQVQAVSNLAGTVVMVGAQYTAGALEYGAIETVVVSAAEESGLSAGAVQNIEGGFAAHTLSDIGSAILEAGEDIWGFVTGSGGSNTTTHLNEF